MNTDKIIKAFKQCAEDKTATFADHIIYAIARAYKHAESEGEANYLSTKYVLRMVSPVSEKRAASELNGDKYGKLNQELKRITTSLCNVGFNKLVTLSAESATANAVDSEDYEELISAVDRLREATSRHYVYIFVRQDIIPEQQAVQAAHATMVAGAGMAGQSFNGKMFDPANTHFVLIGVPNVEALGDAWRLSDANGIWTYRFFEEDMNDELTAVCTSVVTHEKRSTFREYGLLKMQPSPKVAMRTLIDWVS